MKITQFIKGKDNILKRGLFSTIIKVFGALANYTLSYLIAKKFGAEGNGVFALFMTYTIILSTFFYLGLDMFLVKEVSILMKESRFTDVKHLYRKIIKSYLIPVSFFLVIVGYFLFLYYEQPLIIFVSIGLVFNVFIDVNSAMFRGMKKSELYSFFMQFSKYFITVVFFLLPILNDTKEEMLLIYLISLLINALISFFVLQKNFNKIVSKNLATSLKKYALIEIFKTSKEFFFSSILIITLLWIDFILIDVFLEEEEAGIYSVALKLANLVTFGYTAFNAFLAPRISEVYSEGKIDKLQGIITQNFILVFPMLIVPLLIIVFANQFLLNFFGSEFESGWVVLLLLAFAQFVNGIFGPVSLLLQMTNNQKIFQNILIVTFVVKLVCAFIFVDLWRINGIALASFIALCLWTILGSYYVYKKVGIYSWFTIKDLKTQWARFSNE